MDLTASTTIRRPRSESYAFWHQFENLSTFIAHLDDVRSTGGGRSRWTATAPFGKTVEWDAETDEVPTAARPARDGGSLQAIGGRAPRQAVRTSGNRSGSPTDTATVTSATAGTRRRDGDAPGRPLAGGRLRARGSRLLTFAVSSAQGFMLASTSRGHMWALRISRRDGVQPCPVRSTCRPGVPRS
jgi:hypothetical protein